MARRQRRQAGAERAARSEPARPRIAPLTCAGCGAPVPVGDKNEATCRACGKVAPVPPEYTHLRDAHAMSAADVSRLDALAADIARPTPVWKTVAIVVGYTVGGLTLVVMTIGAILGAIGGAIVGDKLDDSITHVLMVLGALLVGFISVPFAGEWIIAFATLRDHHVATAMVTSGTASMGRDVGVAAVIYLLGVVPTALAWTTSVDVSNVKALRGRLAAKPSSWPGGACCRNCGAALDVRPNAALARCIYCGSDNLLTVALEEAKEKKSAARAVSKEVDAEVAAYRSIRSADRRKTWLMLALGPLIAPIVCAGGWLLHRLMSH